MKEYITNKKGRQQSSEKTYKRQWNIHYFLYSSCSTTQYNKPDDKDEEDDRCIQYPFLILLPFLLITTPDRMYTHHRHDGRRVGH